MKKAASSPVLAVGLEKNLLRSHAELPRQAENDRVDQYRLYK